MDAQIADTPTSGLSMFVAELRVFGAIRRAFDPRKIIIAATGLIALQAGTFALDRIFSVPAGVVPVAFPAAAEVGGDGAEPDIVTWILVAVSRRAGETRAMFPGGSYRALSESVSAPIRILASPLCAVFEPGASWRKIVHALLCVLWVVVVWGLGGAAIARIAVVDLAKSRSTSVGASLRFAIRAAGTLIGAPICPLLGLFACSVAIAPFGLVYRLPYVGFAIAGALAIIPAFVGLVMALLAAGLVAGWPLMVAAAASGAANAPDCWSRAYSYLFQRPGSFVALSAWFWLQGIVGIFLASLLGATVVRVTLWGLGLTAGQAIAAGATHPFATRMVAFAVMSWSYSFFWTAAAYLYLWLRREVDGTPLGDVDRPASPIPPAP